MARQTRHRTPLFSPQDRANIRWFWNGYLRSRAPWLLLVLGMILVQGLVYQQFLALTETGLRVIFESGQPSDLIRICAIVAALFTVRGFMSWASPRLSVWLASDAVLKMRGDLIAHLMRLDLAYFERTRSTDIIMRVVGQAQALSQFVGQTTVNAVRDAATLVIVSGYLIWKSPLLFATTVIVMPLIILVIQAISNRIKVMQKRAQDAMVDFMTGLEEMSGGMRTVKISNQEDREQTRLMAKARDMRDLSIRQQSVQALVLPAIDASSAFVYVLVIGGGGYMVLSPQFDMDSAEIITFLLGMALVFDPARLLAGFFTKLQQNLVVLASVRELFDERPSITDAPGAAAVFATGGDIALRGVTFSYDPEKPLMRGIDMTFRGGARTAIVGATGSGKTTVLSLVSRLYEVQAGEISIGGTPVGQEQVGALRRAISVVAQDIVIFNDSIRENIRYARPDATEAEIDAAADAAAIGDLMRDRGDAPLGPKGSQLSGGQKQRIAIARAFLRSAPILLLDEATSALDQRTEDKVKRALARLSKGKTTIVVAHRLSAVVDADWIYVLDAGRVVEQGTHDDLLEKRGLYAGMFEAQKGGYAARAAAVAAAAGEAGQGTADAVPDAPAPQDSAPEDPAPGDDSTDGAPRRASGTGAKG